MRTASLLLLLPCLSCRTAEDRLEPGEQIWFQDVAWAPAWSSDARRIAYISRGEGRTGVFVRPAGGSSPPACLMEGPGPPW